MRRWHKPMKIMTICRRRVRPRKPKIRYRYDIRYVTGSLIVVGIVIIGIKESIRIKVKSKERRLFYNPRTYHI